MWFVVSKKRFYKTLDAWGKVERALHDEIEKLDVLVAEQQGNIEAKDQILKSTEREKVLVDLQSALNMIRDYQRSLSVIGTSDPSILQANTLLEKYGMEGDPGASYLGFKRSGAVKEPRPKQTTEVDLNAIVSKKETLDEYIEREEKVWGEEAYGSGNVRIEARAIDEGDSKEEGYTRAEIGFFDADDSNDFVWIDTPHMSEKSFS